MTLNGRLTLLSGCPITLDDQVGKSTLYLSPMDGDKISLFDGTSWSDVAFAETALTLADVAFGAINGNLVAGSPVVTGLSSTAGLYPGMPVVGGSLLFGAAVASVDSASQVTLIFPAGSSYTGIPLTFYHANYDVFAGLASGALTLDAFPWVSATARTLGVQDGIDVKPGDPSRRYVGSYRVTAHNQTEDSTGRRFLWNRYNRVERKLLAAPSVASWTDTTAAWKPSGGAAPQTGISRVEIFQGMQRELVKVRVHQSAFNNNSPWTAAGIGVDSVNVNSADQYGGFYNQMPATWEGYPGLGWHYFQWLEMSVANGTTTWYGTDGASHRSALVGEVMA